MRLGGVLLGIVLGHVSFAMPAHAQGGWFAGAMGGVSTLSGSSATFIAGDRASTSRYEPKNGPNVQAVIGRHWSDWWSVQAAYLWNRNDVFLTATETRGGAFAFYDQVRTASHHALLGELMLYFRDRRSFVRPYLSAGAGWDRMASRAGTLTGELAPPPASFNSGAVGFRVAVGADLRVAAGWRFRYTEVPTVKAEVTDTLQVT